jgi:hypothetical protein
MLPLILQPICRKRKRVRNRKTHSKFKEVFLTPVKVA